MPAQLNMPATVAFVVLTFILSWLLWLAAAVTLGWEISPQSPRMAIGAPIYLLGVWAPAIVGVALTARAEGKPGVSALLRRMITAPVEGRLFFFALGYFVAIRFAAALLYRVSSGEWPAFTQELWFLMLLAGVFLSPMQAGEEVGWRGFLLPRLSARFGLPAASLIVGVIWAVWHLPFFFVAGADKSGQPFAPYALSVIGMSVAMAWLYWRTEGSLLMTMLLHSAINNMNPIVTPAMTSTGVFALRAPFVTWATTALLWICALFFLLAMRGQRDVRRQRPALADQMPR